MTFDLWQIVLALIKDTVRPTYWVPDSELRNCCVCEQLFSDVLPLHHCRDCGRGVCQNCSQHRKPVPRRGWDKPVRICDSCIKIDWSSFTEKNLKSYTDRPAPNSFWIYTKDIYISLPRYQTHRSVRVEYIVLMCERNKGLSERLAMWYWMED